VSVERINALVMKTITGFGVELAELDSFAGEIIVIENVAAGLIASACVRYNKDPNTTIDLFTSALKVRLDEVVYGRKQ